ncbi:MAG: hypothetical protein ACRCTD_11105 [Beijerinckiaceae bacterium]
MTKEAPPKVKIGFPRDLDKTARAKKTTFDSLLASRARAWDGYFDGLSLAYSAAHRDHLGTLNAIKEQIRNQEEFFKTVILGILIPSFIGGGMAALVSGKGAAMIKGMAAVTSQNRVMLANFGVGGLATVTKDVLKKELENVITGLAPGPGAEWDSAGDTPLDFFLRLRKMVNDYATNAVLEIERARYGDIQEYIALLDAHLLSPFIRNAPMDTSILYSDKELKPVMEIFLWVVWARTRDTKYWLTQITRGTRPDDRGMISKLIDAGLKDDDAVNQVRAWAKLEQLDPILQRLKICGVRSEYITQPLGRRPIVGSSDKRVLNILWVRHLGKKYPDSLLGDLIANIDAPRPTSALEGRPVTIFRSLK